MGPNSSPLTFTIPATLTGKGSITRNKWASLSDDIIFEAPHSPVDMTYTPNVANWVKQELLQGKPRMQKLGIDLQEIKITVKFHYMIKPYKDLEAALNKAAVQGTILQWIWGTGEAVGDFVITTWKEKIKKTDEEGRIYATEIELTLMEYAGPGVAEQTGIDAKKAAFANKVNPVATKAVAVPPTAQESLSKNLTDIKNGASLNELALAKLKKDQITMANYKRSVVKIASDIRKAVNNIQTAITICRNIKNAQSISTAASNLGVVVDSLSGAAGPGVGTTISQFSTLTTDVSNTAGSVESVSQSAQSVKSWFAPLGL